MVYKIKQLVDKGVYSPQGILQMWQTQDGTRIDLCFDPIAVEYYKAIMWGWERVKLEFVK